MSNAFLARFETTPEEEKLPLVEESLVGMLFELLDDKPLCSEDGPENEKDWAEINKRLRRMLRLSDLRQATKSLKRKSSPDEGDSKAARA